MLRPANLRYTAQVIRCRTVCSTVHTDHSSPAHIVHRVQRDTGDLLRLHGFLLDLPCNRLRLLLLCPLQLHAQLLQLGVLLLQGLLQLCRPMLQQGVLKVSKCRLVGLPCQMPLGAD